MFYIKHTSAWSSYKDVFSLLHCKMFWKNECIRKKFLGGLQSCTHITQVMQTDLLIFHTLHKCRTPTQTLSKLLFGFISCLSSFSSRDDSMLVVSSKYSIEQADCTDWMPFQPSNLIEEINPQKSLAQVPNELNQNRIVEKTKTI